MARTSGTSPVYLVHLVYLVYLVCLVHRVGLVQPNKRDKRNNVLLTWREPSPIYAKLFHHDLE